MKLCAMRYAGYTWHHNPKRLEISNGKKVVELRIPYSDDVVKNFGEKPITISGVGELYGEDCLLQYEKLRKIYEKGVCGVLCLPSFSPIYACFKSLTLVATTMKDVLTYSFVFTQVNNEDAQSFSKKEVCVKKGQTLWDISAESGVDMNTLLELNREIMFTNELDEGLVVKLC